MEKKPAAVAWVGGFVLLSLYVNLMPRLFDAGNVSAWFAYWAGFFLLAFWVSKYVLRLDGLKQLGMQRHKGWGANLALGFLVGVVLYAFKYWVYYKSGKYEVAGVREVSFILPMLGQALLAMFFSSILNDITIRGYWYAYFSRRQLLGWYLVGATVLYAFDDFWNGSVNVQNLLFSAILGFTFAYTVLKTGAIWMSLGLHWGGNVMFRVMYGFDGQGVLKLEHVQEGPFFDYLNLLITALLIPVVYFRLRGKSKNNARSVSPPGKVVSPG